MITLWLLELICIDAIKEKKRQVMVNKLFYEEIKKFREEMKEKEDQ